MRGKKKKGFSLLRWLILGLFLLLFALIFSRVTVVRRIEVVGNRTVPKEEIIARSGVKLGQSRWQLSDNAIRKGLAENRYLEYAGAEFDYRGTLTLHIKERKGMGVVSVRGVYFVIDDAGMVLERTEEAFPTGVSGPEIKGLQLAAKTPIVVGAALPVLDTFQLAQMQHVLDALDAANMLGRSATLDVSIEDDLYVMVRENARISLGDDSDLAIKLAIAREVLALREAQGGLVGSTIDVSSGRDAHFIPNIRPTITPTPTATPTIAPEVTPKKR